MIKVISVAEYLQPLAFGTYVLFQQRHLMLKQQSLLEYGTVPRSVSTDRYLSY
jgi:hypothetical protein